MAVLDGDQWRRIGRALFVAVGATESNAVRVTEALVDSSLAGHDSHGVIRIIQYLRAIEAGELDPAGRPETIRETPSSSLVDGKWTFGQVGAEVCMRRAIQQARNQGIALSGLVHVYHIGRLGEYSEMATDAGMIGMVLAGGFGEMGGFKSRGVAPYGGAGGALGTNPISFGLPAGEQPPVMVDYATSSIAGGKVVVARAKGVSLTPNCILDKEGRPSTNPADFFDGGLLTTFGGHKGYGLSVVIEILGQALTGGDTSIEEKLGGSGGYTRAGSVFLCIDPGLFRPAEGYAQAADETLRRIKSVPPAQGFSEVLLPGEPERRSKAERRKEGIPLPDGSWEEMQKQGVKYGIDVSALAG